MVVPAFSATSAIYSTIGELGYLDNNDQDSLIVSLSKRVARFTILIIFIPLITPWGIFYNTCGVFVNGTFTIVTNLTKKTFLGKSSEDHQNMLHLCIAYAIHDMIINLFFIGFITILYTFDQALARTLDQAIKSSIRILCTTMEEPNQNLPDQNNAFPENNPNQPQVENQAVYNAPVVNYNVTLNIPESYKGGAPVMLPQPDLNGLQRLQQAHNQQQALPAPDPQQVD